MSEFEGEGLVSAHGRAVGVSISEAPSDRLGPLSAPRIEHRATDVDDRFEVLSVEGHDGVCTETLDAIDVLRAPGRRTSATRASPA
jgi:hypothetical protein